MILLIVLGYANERETFKSFSSDFIEQTGQKQFETAKLSKIVKKFEDQLNSIPTTGKKLPGSGGHTVSIGWDPLYIPEGKTEEEVRDNLSNMDKKSFLKVLGWDELFTPSEAEVDILKSKVKLLLPNVITAPAASGTVIHKLTKHEDNYFTFVVYLSDKDYNMYYARVKGLAQILNGNVIIHTITFDGLITPFSVMHVRSSIYDYILHKPYGERQRREPKFITGDDIRRVVNNFDKQTKGLIMERNIHAANQPFLPMSS